MNLPSQNKSSLKPVFEIIDLKDFPTDNDELTSISSYDSLQEKKI